MRRFVPLFVLAAALLQADCAGVTGGTGNAGNPGTPPPLPSVSVSVSPKPVNVRAGATQSFSASVSGTSNSNVTWQVNGVAGGNASAGTITSAGLYTAPTTLPNPNSVTVEAVSAADSSASGTSAVTLWNPMPVLASITPNSVSTGAFSITLNGSGFVSGAQAQLAGAALSTTFVSSTQLTATGTASTAGNFAVTVTNPNPGSATSGAQNLQVTSTSGGGPPPPPPACSVMTPGQEGSLNGFVPFPSDNLWNTDISNAPVDPNSAAIINFIGGSVPLHPDFGSGLYNGSIIGIPYLVVDSSQGPVTINFTAYG
ncbi:MAG TPA: IPT/TIG domain-containing protein, partial [Candidatus Bathyarchaeia archaeon]|nr:IPT/TIG domain-containing protein [Candidatus Bathyarchaeia archaeon]